MQSLDTSFGPDPAKSSKLFGQLFPNEQLFPFYLNSRCHLLSTNSDLRESRVWVKREDELSFGVSGSKLRKFSSQLSWLQNEKAKQVLLIGGSHSNSIAGLTQLLKEQGIEPYLVLRGPKPPKRQGNSLLTGLLVDEANIHWVPRQDWYEVESVAETIRKERFKNSSVPILSEGASDLRSLPGACTLGLDFDPNHLEQIATIHVDAGTGLTALGLVLGLAAHGLQDLPRIKIVEIAPCRKNFESLLNEAMLTYPTLQKLKLPAYEFVRSALAPSYGSVNGEVMETIKKYARNYGLLLDPIYTAKLFYTANQDPGLSSSSNKNQTLIIHSGGGAAIFGFSEKLDSYLSSHEL